MCYRGYCVTWLYSCALCCLRRHHAYDLRPNACLSRLNDKTESDAQSRKALTLVIQSWYYRTNQNLGYHIDIRTETSA